MGPNVNAFEEDLKKFVNSQEGGSENPNREIVALSAGGSASLISYTTNTGWTQLSTNTAGGVKTTVFYYNNALASNATTGKLFNNVTIAEFDQSNVTGSKNVVITAYAIQSTGLPSGTTIQNAYGTYFG